MGNKSELKIVTRFWQKSSEDVKKQGEVKKKQREGQMGLRDEGGSLWPPVRRRKSQRENGVI